MANQFSLGAVLDKFRGTQGADQTTKIASEEGEATEKVAEEEAPKEEKEEKAEKAEDAGGEKVAAEEPKELTDADVLKGIAKEAAEVEKTAQEKEASEFGKLFAHSFMEELEMEGTVKQASEAAYNATMETVQDTDLHVKLASVYDEARELTHMTLIEKSAYDETCNVLTKHAEDQANEHLPNMLLGVTKEAYDNTIEALGYEA